MVNAGLLVEDHQARLQPQLAKAVPTTDNGLWKVFPDGRMETTWRIRDGAMWQDGTPFTAEDLVFSALVMQDPELPIFRKIGFDAVESTSAVDPRTFVVSWRKPYIDADQLFAANGSVEALPMPRHLLGQAYLDNKGGFTDLPYWSDEFVGSGPYKPRDWVRGSSLTLDANDRYVLGRPKIDIIDVRFIPDPTTMIANLLSGAVDQPLGRGVTFEQGLQLRDQWSAGHVNFSPGSGIKIWPQLLYANPAIVGDARFRRALYLAIDRQQMVDTLMAGQVEVANTIITPGDAEYAEVIGSAVKYPYDPRQTTQIIDTLGYARGVDGRYHDAAGQPLAVELRSSPMDILRKTKLAVADNWQTGGVGVNLVDDSPQARGDNEYRAKFPGFDISRCCSGTESFSTFRSSEARTAANRYVGENSVNYMNPEYDTLVDRYLTTIPWTERMKVVGEIVHHMTDQVLVLDQFYDATPTATSSRMANVPSKLARSTTNSWNAQEWDTAKP
jgi:peptide/nickel transport system substrate-binding protein